jgi:hypothetical protein
VKPIAREESYGEEAWSLLPDWLKGHWQSQREVVL